MLARRVLTPASFGRTAVRTLVSGPPKLEGAAREAALKGLPAWGEVDGRDAIERTYEFKDFNAAFAFMTRTALVAETADHHPEWFNVYNRVEVTLATHTADGVSQNDIDLATQMDRFAADLGAA